MPVVSPVSERLTVVALLLTFATALVDVAPASAAILGFGPHRHDAAAD